MTARWQGRIARLLAGTLVGVAVGLLYDRNARASTLPLDAGIDWGAVVAAAVTLGSLVVAYELLAWLVRRLLAAIARPRTPPDR